MKNILLYSFLILSLSSCKKELDLKGTITGNVVLYYYRNTDYMPQGLVVRLWNDKGSREVRTDENGRYTFTNVDDGIYNITYSFEGFGTYTRTSYAFIGFGKKAIIDQTGLYPVHDFDFQEAHLTITGDVLGYTILDGFLTCAPGLSQNVYVNLYLDRNEDVSNESYTYSTFDHIWYSRQEGDTIFLKGFINNLAKNEVWYAAVYNRNISDYSPPTTLKKSFNTLKLTVQ